MGRSLRAAAQCFKSVYLSNNLLVKSPVYPDKIIFYSLSFCLSFYQNRNDWPCNINLPRRKCCELETSFNSNSRKAIWLLQKGKGESLPLKPPPNLIHPSISLLMPPPLPAPPSSAVKRWTIKVMCSST